MRERADEVVTAPRLDDLPSLDDDVMCQGGYHDHCYDHPADIIVTRLCCGISFAICWDYYRIKSAFGVTKWICGTCGTSWDPVPWDEVVRIAKVLR